MRIHALALASGLLGLMWTGEIAKAADDPAYIVIGGGAWEVMRDTKPEFDLSYRSSYKLWIFKPHAGFLVAGDGDYYGYAGLLTDIYWGRHIVTTLSTAVGGYGGHGFDLGSHVEFRSGGDVAWRFENKTRLGIGFYHISNAGLTSRNPGSEMALLTLAIPLDGLFSSSGKEGAALTPSNTAVAGFSNVAPRR